MQNIKIYVSGWYEYRIDNPGALVDASKYTPEELDPTGAAGLHDMPPSVWEDIGNALLTEVSKLRLQNPPPEPPGAIQVDSGVRWGLAPPPASA
jgi:hypothetical protein